MGHRRRRYRAVAPTPPLSQTGASSFHGAAGIGGSWDTVIVASLLEPRRVKALEGRLALAATCGWVGTLVVMSDEAVPPIPEGEAPSNGAPAALGAVGVDTLASNLTTPDVAVPAHVADSQDPRGDLENPTSLSALAESPQHGGSRKAASAPFRGGDAAQLVCSIAGERERDGVRFYRLVVRFCDHDFEIERRYTQVRSNHARSISPGALPVMSPVAKTVHSWATGEPLFYIPYCPDSPPIAAANSTPATCLAVSIAASPPAKRRSLHRCCTSHLGRLVAGRWGLRVLRE